MMGFDMCKGCDVPENPRFYDIESEYYYTCSNCPCFDCPHVHNCDGQCAEERMVQNEPDRENGKNHL